MSVTVLLDTSVVLCIAAAEPLHERVLSLLHDAHWTAVDGLPFEIGNALSARFKKRTMTLDQAMIVLDRYRSLGIDLLPTDLTAALRVSQSYSVYAYDAYVLEAALRHRHTLATLDHGMREVARRMGVPLVEIEP